MRNRLTITLTGFALILAACGGGDTGGDTSGANETTTTPANSTTTPEEMTSTTAAGSMDGIHTGETDLGTILVDADGYTLYIFTVDTDGKSSCYDACADLWPAVPADSTISSDVDASMFGTTTRDDGSEQLTVNDMPLYRYTPDTAPGDTNGQGFNDVWFVVDASGAAIEAAASGNVPVADDNAYDY